LFIAAIRLLRPLQIGPRFHAAACKVDYAGDAIRPIRRKTERGQAAMRTADNNDALGVHEALLLHERDHAFWIVCRPLGRRKIVHRIAGSDHVVRDSLRAAIALPHRNCDREALIDKPACSHPEARPSGVNISAGNCEGLTEKTAHGRADIPARLAMVDNDERKRTGSGRPTTMVSSNRSGESSVGERTGTHQSCWL
jgi:hypothetical protein